MAKTRKLSLIIGADVTEFEAKMNKVTRRIDRVGRRAQRFGSSWTRAFTIPLVAAGTAMLKTASDANEVNNKFNAVFKSQSKEVDQWAKTFSRSVGRSTTENKKFLATIQDTLVPLGFARDSAADMSKQVVQLATDLGSFNNLPTAQVVQDIQSAIVGNTETLRKYGVVASQSEILQEALNSGLIKNKNELDANTKAQAILQLLIKGTADAQGDAKRTAGELANSTRGLGSDVKDLAEKFGSLMIPTAKQYVGVARRIVQGLTDMDTETQQAIIKWGSLAAAGGPLMLVFGKIASGSARTARNIKDTVLNLTDLIGKNPALSVIVITVGLLAKSMWDFYHASKEAKKEIRSGMSVTGVSGISESVREALKNNKVVTTSDGWVPRAYSSSPLDTKASRDYGMGGTADITGLSFWTPQKVKKKAKALTQAALDEAREYARKMAGVRSDLSTEILRLQGKDTAADLSEAKSKYDQLMSEAKNSAETRVKIEEWYAARVAEINRNAAAKKIADENNIQMAFSRWESRYGGSKMSMQSWTDYKKGENNYDDMLDAKHAGDEVGDGLDETGDDFLEKLGDVFGLNLDSEGKLNLGFLAGLDDSFASALGKLQTIMQGISFLGGIFGFAEGGIIPEPVAGIGMYSGRGYSFAERGPERVVPNSELRKTANKGQSGNDIALNVYVTANVDNDIDIDTLGSRLGRRISLTLQGMS